MSEENQFEIMDHKSEMNGACRITFSIDSVNEIIDQYNNAVKEICTQKKYVEELKKQVSDEQAAFNGLHESHQDRVRRVLELDDKVNGLKARIKVLESENAELNEMYKIATTDPDTGGTTQIGMLQDEIKELKSQINAHINSRLESENVRVEYITQGTNNFKSNVKIDDTWFTNTETFEMVCKQRDRAIEKIDTLKKDGIEALKTPETGVACEDCGHDISHHQSSLGCLVKINGKLCGCLKRIVIKVLYPRYLALVKENEKLKAENTNLKKQISDIEGIVDEADETTFEENPLVLNWYARLTTKVSETPDTLTSPEDQETLSEEQNIQIEKYGKLLDSMREPPKCPKCTSTKVKSNGSWYTCEACGFEWTEKISITKP